MVNNSYWIKCLECGQTVKVSWDKVYDGYIAKCPKCDDQWKLS